MVTRVVLFDLSERVNLVFFVDSMRDPDFFVRSERHTGSSRAITFIFMEVERWTPMDKSGGITHSRILAPLEGHRGFSHVLSLLP